MVRAVNGISFGISGGETLGLVGESGCGKSTVGKCVLRLVEPTCGEIRFKGVEISDKPSGGELRALRRKIQMIFQDAQGALNPRMRVGDLILEPLRVHRLVNGQGKDLLWELAERVNLPREVLGRFSYELSGGQRQRVVIARALALEPEIIIADEPTASLDVLAQAQILDLMRRLQKGRGLSYLFITHNLRIVRAMAHSIAVMYLGEIVELGSSHRVCSDPAHPYTQALFSATPDPDRRPTRRMLLRGEISGSLALAPGCQFSRRCPQAQSICFGKEPAYRELDGGHFVRCHFARELRKNKGHEGADQTRG
jgi:oligopeptide/dipeptide ABC transporter ATP-binding protein